MVEDIAIYVGLDVSKEKIAVGLAQAGRKGEVRYYGEIADRVDPFDILGDVTHHLPFRPGSDLVHRSYKQFDHCIGHRRFSPHQIHCIKRKLAHLRGFFAGNPAGKMLAPRRLSSH